VQEDRGNEGRARFVSSPILRREMRVKRNLLGEGDYDEQRYTQTNDVNLQSGTLSFGHSYNP